MVQKHGYIVTLMEVYAHASILPYSPQAAGNETLKEIHILLAHFNFSNKLFCDFAYIFGSVRLPYLRSSSAQVTFPPASFQSRATRNRLGVL